MADPRHGSREVPARLGEHRADRLAQGHRVTRFAEFDTGVVQRVDEVVVGRVRLGRRRECRRRGEDATLLMVLNAYHDLVEFTLPETAGGSNWSLLIDTNLDEEAELGIFATSEVYGVTGRSLLLFVLEPDGSIIR